MSKPFVYDEKTSFLYAPNGEFIKRVHCPKAVKWNQLLVDDIEDKSRGCNQCRERILNLDVISTNEACNILMSEPETCVYASKNSANVIFLRDENNPEFPSPAPDTWYGSNEAPPNLPIISTARSIGDIERAIQMGFWPDIRLVRYSSFEISQKFCIYQNKVTGEIKSFGDFRLSSRDIGESWQEVIPWTNYYSHYQEIPVAAYLIPKDLPDLSKVLVPDPIEDLIGATWNQGDSYRATNVTGIVSNKKVSLNPESINRAEFMG